MERSELKGIIFDMDGVLINSEPFHYRVWKETLRRRGIRLDYEVYKPCIGSTVSFLMKLLMTTTRMIMIYLLILHQACLFLA